MSRNARHILWSLHASESGTYTHFVLQIATHKTELGDHDFCLSLSHLTDTDPTSRELALYRLSYLYVTMTYSALVLK